MIDMELTTKSQGISRYGIDLVPLNIPAWTLEGLMPFIWINMYPGMQRIYDQI